MYHCCNDYIFSCNVDSNADSWHVHSFGQHEGAAAPAVRSPLVALKGVASESRCGSRPATTHVVLSSVGMSDICNE